MFSYTLLLVCIAALIDKAELAFNCSIEHMFSPTDPAHIVIQWKTFTVDQDPPCPLGFYASVYWKGLHYYPPRVPSNHPQNPVLRHETVYNRLFHCNVTTSAPVSPPKWSASILVTAHDYQFYVKQTGVDPDTDCENIRFKVYYHMGKLIYIAPPSNSEDERPVC